MQENATINYQNDEYIHILKHGKKGIIAELTGDFNAAAPINIVAQCMRRINNASVQLISYVSPENNRQRYFIALTAPDISMGGNIFKEIINIHAGSFYFLDSSSIDGLYEIFSPKTWNAVILPVIGNKKKLSDGERAEFLEAAAGFFKAEMYSYPDYSNEPSIWVLNVSCEKPAGVSLGYKIKRFLNPQYFNLLDNMEDIIDRRISVSAGFFRQAFRASSNVKRIGGIPDSFLPFGFDAEKDKRINKVNNVADISNSIFPAMGWGGTENKTVPVILRNGIKTGFDIFDGDFTYNGLIIGHIGKSSLINHLAYSHYSKGYGTFIFPLDDQSSHTGILKKTRGQEIVLNINNPISVNPFSLFKDKDSIKEYGGIWVDALYHTVMGEGISGSDERFLKSYLSIAISELWPTYKENLEIWNIMDFIKEKSEETKDDRLADLYIKFKSFMVSYGKFFSGKSAVKFERPFVTVNTEDVHPFRHPSLLGLLVIAVNIHIFIYCDDNRLAGKSKYSLVLMDRADELLCRVNPEILKIINGIVMGSRIRGISLIFALETGAGRLAKENRLPAAIFHNAEWVFASFLGGFSAYPDYDFIKYLHLFGDKTEHLHELRENEYFAFKRSSRDGSIIKLLHYNEICGGH